MCSSRRDNSGVANQTGDALQSRIANYFGLEANGTTFRREVLAGVTTFVTMSYIIAVNPAILKAAGIPEGPSMVATVMTAVVGTLVMGLYANRPFAIAPYMGENAFVAYTVVKVLGYSWQTAMAAVFLAGVMFTLLTVARVRAWMVEAIPSGLSYSFGVGIGLFLTFIGLNESGIVAIGVPGAPVRLGNLATPSVEIAILSFVLIALLMVRRVPGAILLGILISAAIAFVTGVAKPPAAWISMPPNPAPIMLQLDLRGALSVGFFGVLLTIFVMALIDTMGSLIGVSARAGFLDAGGKLPQIERPMLADAVATMFAGLAGTTTAGAYIESAAGRPRRWTHGIDGRRSRTALRDVAVLCAARRRDSGRRVRARADRRRRDDGRACRQNRLRRLHRTDSRLHRDRADELHLQHRRRHHRRHDSVSPLQAGRRPVSRNSRRTVDSVHPVSSFLPFLPLPIVQLDSHRGAGIDLD